MGTNKLQAAVEQLRRTAKNEAYNSHTDERDQARNYAFIFHIAMKNL